MEDEEPKLPAVRSIAWLGLFIGSIAERPANDQSASNNLPFTVDAAKFSIATLMLPVIVDSNLVTAGGQRKYRLLLRPISSHDRRGNPEIVVRRPVAGATGSDQTGDGGRRKVVSHRSNEN